MKILFITQLLPYFPNSGGKIKSWEVLKQLAEKNQIFLVSFVDKKEDLAGEEEVKKICFGVKVFVQPIITQAHQKLKKEVFKSLFGINPFRVRKYFSQEAMDFLKRISQEKNFDAYYFDHDVMLQYLPGLHRKYKKLLVYDEHNLSSQGIFENIKLENNLIEKIAYLIESIKWFFYEKKFILRFNHIFAISLLDKRRLVSLGVNPKAIEVLPVAREISPIFKYSEKKKNILFIGLMSWKPNSDGWWWFYKKIFPLIREKIPEVSLTVIGDHPGKKIMQAAQKDNSLRVLGYVKNLDPYCQKASVFIVPIKSGSGIRIKILESFSKGIPVVSTSKGAEGIKVRHNHEIIIADKEKDFAKAVCKILCQKNVAQNLSEKGLEFIKGNYSLKETRKALEKFGF